MGLVVVSYCHDRNGIPGLHKMPLKRLKWVNGAK